MFYLKAASAKQKIGLVVICIALISTTVCSVKVLANLGNNSFEMMPDEKTITEGKLSKIVVTAGPFDIHRRYRSMEGPWVTWEFKPGEAINAGEITCPEGMVNYAEKGAAQAGMMGAAKAVAAAPARRLDSQIKGLKSHEGPRELYWFKGVKLEVLDEKGKVMPTAEFICHYNLDVKPEYRNRVFTQGHPCVNDRLSSISQGETTQILPPGFGVPIASDEPLVASFQAANRTTDLHRRVRHRCTFYFVKDIDLVYPIKALYWYVPFMTVVTDNNTPELADMQKMGCPSCVGASYGVDAPNDRAGGVFSDSAGHRITGHWVVPPGLHTYHDVVGVDRDKDFSLGNPVIRAAWTHVHPLCTKFSLVEHVMDNSTPVFTAHCQTKTKPGLQIMHLDFITPKGGIRLKQEATYELEVTYNNPFNEAYDSMASMGIYMEDPAFIRPKWSLHDYRPENDPQALQEQSQEAGMSCAIPNAAHIVAGNKSASAKGHEQSNQAAEENSAIMDRKKFPLFDPKKDGPLLTKDQLVEVVTSQGPLDIKLEPKLAPRACTHILALMKNGFYSGTTFQTYEPDSYMMLAPVTEKAPGFAPLNIKQVGQLRRLPLEYEEEAKHEPLALELTRDHEENNSGTSSFCIFLRKNEQLDGNYSIFGHVVPSQRSLDTLNKLKRTWVSNDPPHIVSCKPQ
jgi:cyclophilin family peptidyl-prolyl cis-trans isomerase